MSRFIPSLAVVSFLLIAPLSTAQSHPDTPTKSRICSDLPRQSEPVIVVGQDTSRGRHLGQIYGAGQTSTIYPSAGPQLPLRPSPEVVVAGSSLSPLTVRAVITFADAQGFWKLPSSSAASTMDAKGFFLNSHQEFISIHLPCRQHTVSFKASRGPQQFKELHSLLMDLL